MAKTLGPATDEPGILVADPPPVGTSSSTPRDMPSGMPATVPQGLPSNVPFGAPPPETAVPTFPITAPRHEPNPSHLHAEMRNDPAAIRRLFESGQYPYRSRMRVGPYEEHM